MAKTLAELLEIDAKQKSLSLDELADALNKAGNINAIKQNPALLASITSVNVALTVYTSLIAVYEILLAAMPAIKTATKAAAIPLNPSMATEVAQDIVVMVQKQLMDNIKNQVVNLKDNLLNTEVPGT